MTWVINAVAVSRLLISKVHILRISTILFWTWGEVATRARWRPPIFLARHSSPTISTRTLGQNTPTATPTTTRRSVCRIFNATTLIHCSAHRFRNWTVGRFRIQPPNWVGRLGSFTSAWSLRPVDSSLALPAARPSGRKNCLPSTIAGLDRSPRWTESASSQWLTVQALGFR